MTIDISECVRSDPSVINDTQPLSDEVRNARCAITLIASTCLLSSLNQCPLNEISTGFHARKTVARRYLQR